MQKNLLVNLIMKYIFTLSILLFALASCGKSGKLYLPEEPQNQQENNLENAKK
jgi:predicted small lipoprotein YifL